MDKEIQVNMEEHEGCVLVANRERQIAELRHANEVLHERMVERDRVASRQLEHIEELEDEVKREHTIAGNRLTEVLAARRVNSEAHAEVSAARSCMGGLEIHNKTLREAAKGRDEIIVKLTSDCQVLQDRVETYQQAAAGGVANTLHGMINERDKRLANQGGSISTLMEQVAVRDRRVARRDKRIESQREGYEETIETLHDRIREKEERNTDQAAQMYVLQGKLARFEHRQAARVRSRRKARSMGPLPPSQRRSFWSGAASARPSRSFTIRGLKKEIRRKDEDIKNLQNRVHELKNRMFGALYGGSMQPLDMVKSFMDLHAAAHELLDESDAP